MAPQPLTSGRSSQLQRHPASVQCAHGLRRRRRPAVPTCPDCRTQAFTQGHRGARTEHQHVCSCVGAEALPVLAASDTAPRESAGRPRWLQKIRQAPNVPALYNSLMRLGPSWHGPVVHSGMVKLANLIRYHGKNPKHRQAIQQISKDLVIAARNTVGQFSPRAAVDVLWCCSFLPYKDPILVHQLLSSLSGTMQLLPESSLFKLLYTLARMKYPVSQQWLDEFLSLAAPHATQPTPQQFAALLVACKQLQLALPQPLLEASFARTAGTLHECQLGTLSSMLDCLAGSGGGLQPPSSWQQELLAATQGKMHLATPKELARIASGLPHLGCKVSDAWLVDFLSECLEQLQAFSAEELTAVVCGLAALRVKPDSTWLQAYMFQTKDRLPDFLVTELASVVTSLARLGHKPSPAWLRAVCNQAEQTLVFAPPGEVAVLLLSLSKIGHTPDPAFISCVFQHTRHKLCLLNPAQAVDLLAAMGGLQFPVHPAWCSELFMHTQALLPAMGTGLLVELVGALAGWGVCPPPVWQKALARALGAQMQRFRDPQRVHLITHLHKLSRSDRPLEPVLMQVITQLWEHTQPQVTYHMPATPTVLPGSPPLGQAMGQTPLGQAMGQTPLGQAMGQTPLGQGPLAGGRQGGNGRRDGSGLDGGDASRGSRLGLDALRFGNISVVPRIVSNTTNTNVLIHL